MTRKSMLFSRIHQRLKKKVEQRRKTLQVKQHIEHVSGPQKFMLKDDDIAIVLLGRDIGYHVDEFVRYHRALGAQYIVFVDNGSTDDSIEKMSSYDNTIVARCDLNFRDYQRQMREASATMFAEGGWRLALDADEMLDFVGIDRLGLGDIVNYMNEHGYTGLVAQMLEMVPPGPLPTSGDTDYRTALDTFDSYSLGNISKFDYHGSDSGLEGFLSKNASDFEPVKVMYGGLRKSLFDEDCCLTKHVLFRMGPGVKPLVQPHATTGLRCADFTVALRHYKFAGSFLQREQTRIEQNRISHTETAKRVKVMNKYPDMSFLLTDSQSAPTPQDLLEADFLVASERAKSFFGAPD